MYECCSVMGVGHLVSLGDTFELGFCWKLKIVSLRHVWFFCWEQLWFCFVIWHIKKWSGILEDGQWQICTFFGHMEWGSQHVGVITLALGSRPKQGVARLRAKRRPGSHATCSWECKKMWGNRLSHSQGNSHIESWNPGGLLNVQRAIVGVKTQWIEEFFISLERYWNLDVENGLASPIWTSETQVVPKRKVGS